MRALRAEGRRLFPPTQAIRSIKLYHRQIYKYAYHRPKLAMLRQGREHARFAGVADFLERVPIDCPHELFRDSERASQKAASFLDTSRLIVVEKENAATRMAALVIPTVGDNRLRHEALQRFMLANDSTTLAIEVPIWLGPADIKALEAEHGISLLPPGSSAESITGHIDFLQVRNGAVHILDYKPGARADHPIAQLMIYALALTKLGARAQALRYQMRVVRRGGVLRILPAHAPRAPPRPSRRVNKSATQCASRSVKTASFEEEFWGWPRQSRRAAGAGSAKIWLNCAIFCSAHILSFAHFFEKDEKSAFWRNMFFAVSYPRRQFSIFTHEVFEIGTPNIERAPLLGKIFVSIVDSGDAAVCMVENPRDRESGHAEPRHRRRGWSVVDRGSSNHRPLCPNTQPSVDILFCPAIAADWPISSRLVNT